MRRLATGTVVKIKLIAYDKACRLMDTEPVSFVCPIEHTSLSFGFDAATLLAKLLKLLEFPGLSRLTPRVAQALAGQRGTLGLQRGWRAATACLTYDESLQYLGRSQKMRLP